MEEIKVGEYIRTTEGCIVKIKNDEHLDFLKFSNAVIGNITKHSKDIIDLIEVGDIVNGWRVGAIYYGEKEGVMHTINFELEDGQLYSWKEKFGEETCDFQLKIETILTHEQYEQNCYKAGED